MNKLPKDWEAIVLYAETRHQRPRELVERCYTLTQKPPKELTDVEICKIADSMPDGVTGFWKTWGYRQFARAVIAAHIAKQREPERVKYRAAHNPSEPGRVAVLEADATLVGNWEWLDVDGKPQEIEVVLP